MGLGLGFRVRVGSGLVVDRVDAFVGWTGIRDTSQSNRAAKEKGARSLRTSGTTSDASRAFTKTITPRTFPPGLGFAAVGPVLCSKSSCCQFIVAPASFPARLRCDV